MNATRSDHAPPAASGVREIEPASVARTQGVHLVDVREPHELAGELGRIAGVDRVPLATLDAAAARWDKDADIVLICRSGNRSSRAAELLARQGFRRVFNMTGGMLAYAAAGLPLQRDQEPPP